MIVYFKDKEKCNLEVLSARRENFGDIVCLSFTWIKICHMYLHPDAKLDDFRSLMDNFRHSDIILGDLNINTRDQHGAGMRRINSLCQQISKVSVLDEPTHRTASQPDHILAGKDSLLPIMQPHLKISTLTTMPSVSE